MVFLDFYLWYNNLQLSGLWAAKQPDNPSTVIAANFENAFSPAMCGATGPERVAK
jgi:hypothetical protein